MIIIIVIIIFGVIIINHNDDNVEALSQDHDGLAARQGPTS